MPAQVQTGLPDPDPFVRQMDPDPSINKNWKKNIDSYCFVTFVTS